MHITVTGELSRQDFAKNGRQHRVACRRSLYHPVLCRPAYAGRSPFRAASCSADTLHIFSAARAEFVVPLRKLFCGHVAHLLRRSHGVRSSAPRRKLPGRRFRALAYLTYALTRRCRFACRLISSPRLSRRSRRRCGGFRRKSSRPRDGRASSCPRRARERIRRKRPRCPL